MFCSYSYLNNLFVDDLYDLGFSYLDKFGMILFRKDEKQGSFAYIPEFKRVTMREYLEYKQRFAKEIDTYFNRMKKDEEKAENVIFGRVIKMNLDKKKQNKRRFGPDSDDDNGPFLKRQRYE